jgi:tetratricopeptide (TPR) repeat protein
MTDLERIEEYSRRSDLDGLVQMATQDGRTLPPDVRRALADSIGHHYRELWMAYEDGRLTGDQIEIVGQIVDLLEARNRLDPSSESEVQRSGWLMELASLHENRDAKRRYLTDALAVIDSANERYPGDVSVLVGKARVLASLLLVPGSEGDDLESPLLESMHEAFASMTVATAREISSTVSWIREELEEKRPDATARVLSGFRAAVRAASPNHPDVVLISATQSVSTVNGWDVPDPNRSDLEEIDEWLMAADALPRYGPDAMDRLADEVFLLSMHFDLHGDRRRREHYARKALEMYERIIRDYPGFLQAYEDKAGVYRRRADDLIELGDLPSAAALLQEGISWLEQVDSGVVPPRLLYRSRLRLHWVRMERIEGFRDREHNLEVAALIRRSIDARLEFYREVFRDRREDYYAAHDNRDFEDLARLQLKCGQIEDAWSSLTEWNEILREQRALWGYLPRDIGRLRFDEDFASVRERLEQLLTENAERDRKMKDSPYDKG